MNLGTLNENDVEIDDVVPGDQSLSYRQFRTAVLVQCTKDWQPRWGQGETSGFSALRKRICAFRKHLASRGASWIRSGRYPARHIYRGLGIDPNFTLTLSRRERWLRAWMRVTPTHTMMRLARRWLRMARTYEGRTMIFAEYVPFPLIGRRIDYDRALDYGVMRWGRFSTSTEMDRFSRIHFDWIRAAHQLGLNKPLIMVNWAPPLPHKDAGELMWLLVREGVITQSTEREWVDRWHRPCPYAGYPDLNERRVGQLIRLFREHGVERAQIVKTLCKVPHHHMEPEPLARSLTLLQERGIKNVTLIVDGLEDSLAGVASERWLFLLDDLGVRDPATIVQFRPLLESDRPYSAKLAMALLARGASAPDLVRCQELLLAAGGAWQEGSPVSRLAILTGAPYRLQLDEIVQANTYLCESGDLAAFLAVLNQHGFGDPTAILRFQVHYREIKVEALSRLIALARSLKQGDVIDEVMAWVAYAGKAGYVDAYEYLARALNVCTVRQLRRVSKLGFLGVLLLRHLIEEQGLSTRQKLMAWFYDRDRAFGIQSVRWWGGALDPVTKLLFDDAFTRHAFNFWEPNLQCIVGAVRARIAGRLGSFPYEGSEDQRNRYNAAADIAYDIERAALFPVLPRLLQATSGILFRDVVACAIDVPDALAQQLAQLAPLLDELLAGHGPVGAMLTQLEAEAIGLVYRTPPDTVRSRWHEVVGRQADIAEWGHAPCYPMKLRGAMWTLQRPLDREGFEALGRAAQWAATFVRWSATDLERACEGLAPHDVTIGTKLADLAPQLGLLLSIVADDPAAEAWMKAVPALLAVTDESGYDQVLRMHAFLHIGLTDALAVRRDSFCRTLPNRSALLLARRLGVRPGPQSEPHALLHQMLDRVTQEVCERFGGWASVELAKFGSDDVSKDSAILNAMVTKHPAAFFAKEAVKLCTAGNVAMWKELRQAHLVVFDPVHRSLQGMAFLYREILTSLHPSRPVLVIRAINPTNDAMAAYHVSSIVDAFLSTVVQVARDSGCVAVAFPQNTGMHLLSNLDPINRDIQDRYLAEVRTRNARFVLDETEAWLRPVEQVQVAFDAYERGVQPVNELYVVWRGRA